MNGKNGFTLIDFLAIIGVLAIVGLVFTPTIFKIMQEQQKKEFIKTVEELVNTAKNSVVENGEIETNIEILDGKYTSVTNLKVKENLPIFASIKVNKEGAVAIAAQDTNWCITKTYDDDKLTIKEYKGYCDVYESASIGGVAVDIVDGNKQGLHADGDNTSYDACLPYAS